MGKIALIGKPNAGKTSLFNQICGHNQKVGNYSGATTGTKTGMFNEHLVIDYPGLHTLNSASSEKLITQKAILQLQHTDKIVFVLNGSEIENSLLLFSQIADLQIPTLVVINFKDELQKSGVHIDIKHLKNLLGCEVFFINSRDTDQVDAIKEKIENNGFQQPIAFQRSKFDILQEDNTIQNDYATTIAGKKEFAFWEKDHQRRKSQIKTIINKTVTGDQSSSLTTSKKIDKVLLHPVWGTIIFLLTMLSVFQGVFLLSAYPMDWIEQFFDFTSQLASHFLLKNIIISIGSVMVFIPQIALLFFMIGILEHTGYLSRIAFICDAVLKKFGLSGQSVVPLVSSLGCAVPAIMSARIIKNPKERFAVIMATPLMTCSARLPVYTILISVLLPDDQTGWWVKGLILLGLYLAGLFASLLVSYILSGFRNAAAKDHWVLELPVYRLPDWKNIFNSVFNKTKTFVVNTGKIIIIISICLSFLAQFSPKSDDFIQSKISESLVKQPLNDKEAIRSSVELEYSYLGLIGKGIEPIIKPLGYDWKMGIAIVSSLAAREVFGSTLISIYGIDETRTQVDHGTNVADVFRRDIVLSGKKSALPTAISLLVFYAFAMQCTSTFAVVKKETKSWRVASLQFGAYSLLAYVLALVTYQSLNAFF